MLYIAENIRNLRKGKGYTQEEVAEMLNVSAQSVSKWERGDTLPDIALLPALANLYKVSVDAILGMDKINDQMTKRAIFTSGYEALRGGDFQGAIEIFSQALKIFPNDEDILSYLAMALALEGDPAKLSQAVALCQRVLAGGLGEKVHHTTRAALCFIYMKAGEKEKAVAIARNLPHTRESREVILEQLKKEMAISDIDAQLRYIAIGEID